MQPFFEFLNANPFILLFFTVATAVLAGKLSFKGYAIGKVAAAMLVACALGMWASGCGVRLRLDEVAKSFFFYLFIYAFGMRVGPSFLHGLNKGGLAYAALACISSVLGLVLVVLGARFFDLPLGAAGGILAGSQTMAAAMGTAEMALTQGVPKLPAGTSVESVSSMIALGYAITCIWGTIGLVLVCKYLPRWWGVDVKQAAKECEAAHGIDNVYKTGLAGYRLGALRTYILDNSSVIGLSIGHFWSRHPQYRILNIIRAGSRVEVSAETLLEAGDIIAIAGGGEDVTANLGLIGPEVADPAALNIPMDQAEILVTEKKFAGRPLSSFRGETFAGQLQLVRIERGGVPVPVGADTVLQRFDVLFVTGLKTAVHKMAELVGKAARPASATALLTLSVGMVLGLLFGQIHFSFGGFPVGLGNAGGLLLSGILMSAVAPRFRFVGHMSSATRSFVEEMSLVTFVSIVGINAGAVLLPHLTGNVALSIFLTGFVASTIPPIATWAVGYHFFKLRPAMLIGGVAGARSNTKAVREVSRQIGSEVPWSGFPVACAVSGVLLTGFGYAATWLSK